MSHTTVRPHFRRLAVGLTAAAAAITLLGAEPAYAASSEAAAGVTSNGTLSIAGAVLSDNLTASPALGKLILLSAGRPITAGAGCVQLSDVKLQCTGVTAITFNGGSGNDRFNNASSIPSTLNGGTGDDVLIGGSGFDTARGNKGADKCTAEVENSCEL